MSTLIRTQVVIRRVIGAGMESPRVIFSREPDEDGDLPHTHYLPRDVWEDLGRPDAITVTIDPGDLLNGDGDLAEPA